MIAFVKKKNGGCEMSFEKRRKKIAKGENLNQEDVVREG